MDTVARATEIVRDLTRHVPFFKDWKIRTGRRDNKAEPDGHVPCMIIEMEEDVERAIVWINRAYDEGAELMTFEENIAHEVAHAVIGEKVDEERMATRIGLILVAWARERANCKCGE